MTAERENIPKVIRVPGGFCVSWAGVVLNERFPTHARARDHAESITKAAESWYQSRSRPLVEALKEIQKGEGTFSMDHLEHASNTIESMKEIARKALETHNAE